MSMVDILILYEGKNLELLEILQKSYCQTVLSYAFSENPLGFFSWWSIIDLPLKITYGNEHEAYRHPLVFVKRKFNLFVFGRAGSCL